MPWAISNRCFAVWMLLLVASLSMSACSSGGQTDAIEENFSTTKDHTTTGGTTREDTKADLAGCSDSEARSAVEADARYALEADARAFAKDEGIPVEEARRRLQLGGCFTDDLADLERALRSEKADTFAGLWGKHPPEYGYVVLFTRDGEQTIRPYLEDEPERFRRLIEVRSGAEATLEELAAAQREVGQVFDRLKNDHAASGTNLKKNRVEIYVEDKERFEAALWEEGARLPEHVVVVESGLCCLRPE